MEKDILQYVIVVIAVIVWVVSKVGKATKTPKIETSTPPVLTEQQSKNLDDWWKKISQEMQPAPATTVKKVEKSKAIDSVSLDYFENLHKNYKNAEFALKHTPVKQLEVIEDFGGDAVETYRPLNINIKQKDEARRALVYSEIFNRKY